MTGPAGRPGVRNFPRTRHAAPPGECHRSVAVAKYLARRAERERAVEAAPASTSGARRGAPGKRNPWRGRPGQTSPGLAHSPSTMRPVAPPLREAGARASDPTPWTIRRNSAARREHMRPFARPRPSRVLAELVADATP